VIRRLLFVIAALAATLPAFAAPGRVVSTGLCVDDLLLRLVERERVAGVTWLAADPLLSSVTEVARGIPLHRGKAEEVLRFKPDLVVGEIGANIRLGRFLALAKVPLVEIPRPGGFAALTLRIRALAKALEVEARGEALIADIERRLAAVTPVAGRPLAAVLRPRGIAAGKGTPMDEVLTRAGYRNLSAERASAAGDRLSIESLVFGRPDLLILDRRDDPTPSDAQRIQDHPILAKLFADGRMSEIPNRLWLCPGPAMLDAIERLTGTT